MKEQFIKWAESKGHNVTETDVQGFTFASVHVENMWLAFQEGKKAVVDSGAKQAKPAKE